jgi:phosphatidylglycerophosphatase A
MVKSRAALWVATWFGCGYFPRAPGTVGSAAGLAIAAGFGKLNGWQPWHFAALCLVTAAPAIWAADAAARQKGQKDPPIVVVDEVLGQWLAIAGARTLNWKAYVAAFLAFRLFDIWKPVPVRQCEQLPGGIGIVADDLVAGLYAALVLFIVGCFNLY